jgi:hypothetical protein
MTERESSSGVVELATQAVAPIEEELRRRLTTDVGERDALAIETALLKAFMNGVSTGSTEAADLLIESAGAFGTHGSEQLTAAQLDQPQPRIDPWAERYGPGR